MNFEQAMRCSGLIPRDILADDRWRRCPTEDHPKKRNGAYKMTHDGIGLWRNWATEDAVNVWRDEHASAPKPIDEARLKRNREQERKRRINAMRGARAYWGDAAPIRGLHPYISAKGLTALGCSGLRTHADKLVVPIWSDGWIISVQTIDGAGEKRFWPGAPVAGGSFTIERQGAALTAICEGLSTGLAVYQSVRAARVVVAFNAGNIMPVVDKLRPSGSVVICADNDYKTEAARGVNPGISAAKNAAELIGCGVAYPTDIEGTDMADALKEYGDRANRKIERLVLAGARYVSGAVP